MVKKHKFQPEYIFKYAQFMARQSVNPHFSWILCSTKCKLSLNMGPHISQRWAFWGDRPALRVLSCGITLQKCCAQKMPPYSPLYTNNLKEGNAGEVHVDSGEKGNL